MKVTIQSAHRNFFKDSGYIEFEELLQEKHILFLKQEIRKGGTRDLWRNNSVFHKMIEQKQIAHLASELLDEPHLRLGYDQVISQKTNLKDGTLHEMSSLQGIVCGALISLEENESDFFPKKPGNILFFSPDNKILWSTLPKTLFFLITYTEKKAVYIHNENDLYMHNFKHLGYSYGDLVQNPFVCK